MSSVYTACRLTCFHVVGFVNYHCWQQLNSLWILILCSVMKKIDEMKERLKADDVEVNWNIHNDHTLKRFLRSRAGDVDKAYEAFVAMIISC